ncbi:MAG: phosphatidylglycerophosphatase A [Verrucomicrobia bacterium]|nr:phosphatidylglycerophosphatase A [Verrucomicrobiota bacterium]MBU1735721.1 phosphatidylglycerophosphatase A [Verrucomicrobiota bacterium]MBU1857569.1 phosphatidylglycerophosphatase A [Verrucomicrobiota bacterium]
MELARASGWRKPIILLATGFGLGLSPVASGTAGTLLGLPIMLGLAPLWAHPAFWAHPVFRAYSGSGVLMVQMIAALGLTLLAIPICDVAEKHFGRKDDGRIVADEFMTFPIGLLGLPLCPWVLALAFFTNRVFDVLKPFPAKGLQRLPGGLGIVVDDGVAALYSLLVNHAVYYLVLRYGVS